MNANELISCFSPVMLGQVLGPQNCCFAEFMQVGKDGGWVHEFPSA